MNHVLCMMYLPHGRSGFHTIIKLSLEVLLIRENPCESEFVLIFAIVFFSESYTV